MNVGEKLDKGAGDAFDNAYNGTMTKAEKTRKRKARDRWF
jgi:hypothetical protein